MHVSRLLRPAAPLLLGAALGVSGLPRAHAQPVVPVIPEKESPFFVLNDEERDPARRAEQAQNSPANQYPRNKTSENTSTKMFTRFFTEMFASVKLGKAPSDSKLAVEPSTFSLDDRRELTVTYTVMNHTAKLVKLDFPTSQRLEILVRDGSGKVIQKWSDDQAFEDVSGVVMINPGERIQYEEKVATRDMKPSQTYTIEASVANNPEFTKTATVTPSAKPRTPLPLPQQQPTPASTPAPLPTPGA